MKVSMIMPVYNREAYVKEAITSILNQTLYDLELIVIDDCSTDRTVEVVRSIDDARLRLIQNPVKSTLPLLRNQGISLVRGEYMGYMDSDDIAALDRLEKEVAFLDNHLEYGAVSCHYRVFGDKNFDVRLPLTHDDICGQLLVRCVMNYGGSLFRRSLFDKGLRHSPEYFVCEDYRFWTELIGQTQMANIDEFLVYVRFGDHQSTRSSLQDTEKLAIRRALLDEIHVIAFQRMGIALTESEIRSYNDYLQCFKPEASYSAAEKKEILHLYQSIRQQLQQTHPEFIAGFTRGLSNRFPFLNVGELA